MHDTMLQILCRLRTAVLVTAAVVAMAGSVATASRAEPAGRIPVADGTPQRCEPSWVTAWQTSPQPVTPDLPLAGRTLRLLMRPQVTGSEVRVHLSNLYGAAPLLVGAVSAARAGDGAALVPATARRVTFGGRSSAEIAPGREVVSDPVPLVAEVGRPLAVSLVLPRDPEVVTAHPVALQTSYVSRPGDFTLDDGAGAFDTRLGSWPVLTGVEVLAPRPVNAVVAMGDSITDGVGSGADTDARWSDALAARLARRGGAATMAVLNAGISRNELLADRGHDGGDAPLTRLHREVVDLPAATDIVLHIGTNDIAAGRAASEIIAGLEQFSEVTRGTGRRVFLTTITPSRTGPHGTPRAIAVRDEVNRWVREHGPEQADGVFDFAGAVADPKDRQRLRARYDSGDGLHLSAAGYRALAAAVDVERLTGSPCLADRSPASVRVSGG